MTTVWKQRGPQGTRDWAGIQGCAGRGPQAPGARRTIPETWECAWGLGMAWDGWKALKQGCAMVKFTFLKDLLDSVEASCEDKPGRGGLRRKPGVLP